MKSIVDVSALPYAQQVTELFDRCYTKLLDPKQAVIYAKITASPGVSSEVNFRIRNSSGFFLAA